MTFEAPPPSPSPAAPVPSALGPTAPISARSAAELVHDAKPPQALRDFMMTGWKGQPRALPRPLPAAAAHASRRRALSALFPGQALIIPTGHEKRRANDTRYRFRPGSDFVYLTGNLEPDCVLVLAPTGSGHAAHLFVEPNPGRSDETFFTDRKKGELWVGARLGVEQSRARYAVEAAHPLSELKDFVKVQPAARVLRGLSRAAEELVPVVGEGERDKDLAVALSELRLVKDSDELRELRKVIAATQRGFEDVVRSLRQRRTEREIEGLFALRARVEGNDVGYGPIAAAGAHACILHWTRNDGAVAPGDLLLLDAGVEGHALYTADLTRTVPISGRFSKAQRELYELVWAAQQAAFAAVRPGNDFMEPNRRAMRVLAEGLDDLGILPTDVETALRDDQQLYKRYTLHNISHMLGLDVHDCAKARQEVYRYGPLRPGMVLTIEPGLYFQRDDLTVPSRFRGLGVRIEDDVLVTKTGMKNLSAALPSHPDAVEAWMARLWKAKPRSAAQ